LTGELLKNNKGMLHALVDESDDRDSLAAMAEGKASTSKINRPIRFREGFPNKSCVAA
jgi:hypothetical protein